MLEIYNMHAHIFPEKIAPKAVEAIGHFYGIGMDCRGTKEDLIKDGDKIGVKKYLISSIATKAIQVRSINYFLSKEIDSNTVGFASLHPDSKDMEGDIDNLIKLGLKGVKLHPDFQAFNIDDKKTYPMFEICQGRLPFLIHMGDKRYNFSSHQRLLKILELFPKLIVIAAHLGGYSKWDELAAPYLGHERVFFDTSSSLMFLDKEKALSIIKRHGIERVFFGTDFPMWNHEDELNRFYNLPLSEKERELILNKNPKNFLSLYCHNN